MEIQIDGDGVRIQLAGEEGWRPCEPGVVLAAARNCEFFIPAANVVEHRIDVLRATVDGLLCSFDLTRYGVATIVDDGTFFVMQTPGSRTIARHLPL